MSGKAPSVDAKKLWGGGFSPFNVSYGKIMMWFFLVSDAFSFSGLLVSYGFMRHRFEEVWPVAEDVFTHFPFLHGDHPLLYVAFMTFILIMSSVTMVLAVEAGHRMNKKGVVVWMTWTIVGGLIFVGSQAWEWYHFIHGTELGALQLADGSIVQWLSDAKDGLLLTNGTEVTGADAAAMIQAGTEVYGANLTVNEYGVPLFANFFFFITGFHGTHVFSGVVINFVILVNVLKGTYEKRGHYEMVEKVGLYWHFVDLVWVFVFTFFYLI
ncbi:MAG: cytochrome oxidase subunit III [Verrucomicrobia bacterium]|nr:cytochrome oxidase subunit III [Verrucomicrobiota bacterium]